MFLFLKSTSRTVHHCREQPEEDNKIICTATTNEASSTSLTVWRKSLLLNCSGFTVINGSDGGLAYRVDNYTRRPDQIVLMDGSGNPIFTILRRKKLGLLDNYWLIYEGEVHKYCKNTTKKPICCVRKNISIFMQRKVNVLAYVYHGTSEKRHTHTVEGSYKHRSCKILDYSRRVLGEIKKKYVSIGGVSFGSEVFEIIVKLEFDSRFAMAIVLSLDQMFS
ncbi:hypothetical protein CDL12_26177 [Handroanthus impetiginosus]|uniref:Tubby C-terminal domain-containing protein n=1 Tax=Handroanthus impetiginosus TaxID=429701 RepID=A0A2G9G7X4_9LAMI|nr:hypothetical protein CDL12_26177 [Handroanthus impetiginosus]